MTTTNEMCLFVSLISSPLHKSYYPSAMWALDGKQAANQASDFTEDAE